MALTGGQVERRNVMSTVSVLELDGSGTGCESKQLMTETNTHDRDLRRFHETSQVVDSFLAMSWVTWAVRDEDTVEVVGDFVDGEVVWKDCNACTATNQAAKDILFDTAVNDCYVHVAGRGADVEGSFGADFLDEIDLLRIDESFVLIGVVFFSNCDTSQ